MNDTHTDGKERSVEDLSNLELAEWFNEKNGCDLYEQALKLSEEQGEVSEAVLGYSGDLLFKESMNENDVRHELADLFATGYYVAALCGIEDFDGTVRARLVGNLAREGSS